MWGMVSELFLQGLYYAVNIGSIAFPVDTSVANLTIVSVLFAEIVEQHPAAAQIIFFAISDYTIYALLKLCKSFFIDILTYHYMRRVLPSLGVSDDRCGF